MSDPKRVSFHEHFGSFLSDGDHANVFRFTEIEPVLSSGGAVVFDFRGVTKPIRRSRAW